jgi:hypothetical protein
VWLFQHGIAEDKKENRGDRRALGQATTIWLWHFRLLVEAKGDLSVCIECLYPPGKIGWHSALEHDLLQGCGVDFVEGTFDIVRENGWSLGGIHCTSP